MGILGWSQPKRDGDLGLYHLPQANLGVSERRGAEGHLRCKGVRRPSSAA